MYDFQKANGWKRISAKLFDLIITVMLVVGIAYLLSAMFGYDSHYNTMNDAYKQYEAEYGIDLNISSEDYAKLSEAEKANYAAANEAFGKDEKVVAAYSMLINLTLIITTFSILFAYLLFELAIPLWLGNGQTLGKKVFGIGVMREDGVRITPLLLFIRTILGKYTVEVMAPVLSVIMIYFNLSSMFSIIIILGIFLLQLLFIFTSKARTPIHDKLAHTVTVDIASQMIFDTPEAMMEYKQCRHDEAVKRAEY